MKNIIDELIFLIDQKKNPCIVGLDSDFDKIPNYLKKENSFKGIRDTIIEFNKLTIDAIKDIVPAVKIQIAFYEQYGIEGLKAFKETIKYAKKNKLLVIADVKRGDIGNTAKAYALAYSSSDLEVDFITVNPYLGSDSISPFIEVCKKQNKGIFILVKTSNSSSSEIQDQITLNGKKIYEKIAEYVDEIGKDLKGEKKYSCIGAVVGATHSKDAKVLRTIMPNTFFLVPGYGTQGANAEDIMPCFNQDGYGSLINASRNVIFAYLNSSKYTEKEFYLAARESAMAMQNEFFCNLKKYGKLPKSWEK